MTLSPATAAAARATDPMAAIDLPHFCQSEGHELLEVRAEGAVSLYVIRRGPGRPPPETDLAVPPV
jgi:tRNA 2-thiouridine synthesizing protein A